jgi:hypothetical protein
VFWIALVVLVANDHWLKHSQLAPGWLTGKLSDFAGLIVAPVVLASLTRARSARGRLACIAVVAVVFAGFELFPSWVRAAESLAVGGHRLRMWPDVTDLLALAVLPLTWLVMTRSSGQPLRLGAPLVHRTGLALACLACVATSTAELPPLRTPLIVNKSHTDITVTARRYLGAVDCIGQASNPSEPQLQDTALVESDFSAPVTATIEPTDLMELGSAGEAPSCGAYWISAPALADLIITFAPVMAYGREENLNSLVLEGPSSELRPFANRGVWISEVPAP